MRAHEALILDRLPLVLGVVVGWGGKSQMLRKREKGKSEKVKHRKLLQCGVTERGGETGGGEKKSQNICFRNIII